MAALQRQDEERAQTEAARLKGQRDAPPQPRVDVAPPPPLSQAQICKRDADRLARLRTNPAADQVVQFSRELGCEDLRPQIQRLAESLGVDVGVKTQAASLTAPVPATSQSKGVVQNRLPADASEPVDAASQDMVQTCKRDGDELARIRANPDRESALRFTRKLKCEDLREQAARLLESVGN